MLEPIDDDLKELLRAILQELLSNNNETLTNPETLPETLTTDQDPWILLAAEGNDKTLRLLQKVEQKQPGYSTIIIGPNGFSENDDTHNAVLNWLRDRNVMVYSPQNEIYHLNKSLHPIHPL